MLHILEVAYNKPITEGQTHSHLQNVTQVALNQIGGINDRQLALIDVNKDLFLVAIRTTGFGRVCKIGMIHKDFIKYTKYIVISELDEFIFVTKLKLT